MSVLAFPGGSSSSSGGGSEVLALAPSEFFDPRVLFRNSSTTWRRQDWDSAFVYAASAAVFTADPFCFMTNHDLTQLWSLGGAVTATQRINKVTIATNALAQDTVISGQNAGDIIIVACRDPRTDIVYCGARDAIAADGLMNWYTLNHTTGVLTFVTKSDLFLSSTNQGMGIDPSDSQIYLWTEFSGVPQCYKLDKETAHGALVYTCPANTPWRNDNFNVTPRRTFFGGANAFCSEGALPNFAFLRTKAQAGVTAVTQVMVPPINSKMYLGCPIFRSGAIYTLEDGEDISASITSSTVLWPLSQVEEAIEDSLSPQGVSATLTGAAITLAYVVLITVPSSYQRGRILQIRNNSDRDVYLSFNSTVDHFFVATGSDISIDLGAAGFGSVTNIWARAITSTATSGTLDCSLLY